MKKICFQPLILTLFSLSTCLSSTAPRNEHSDSVNRPKKTNSRVSALIKRHQAGSVVAKFLRNHWMKITGLTLCVGGAVWWVTREESVPLPREIVAHDYETELTAEVLETFKAVPVSFKSQTTQELITIEIKGNETLAEIKKKLNISNAVRLEFNGHMTDFEGRDHDDIFMYFILEHGGPVNVGKFREWLTTNPPLIIADDIPTPPVGNEPPLKDD